MDQLDLWIVNGVLDSDDIPSNMTDNSLKTWSDLKEHILFVSYALSSLELVWLNQINGPRPGGVPLHSDILNGIDNKY